MKKLELGQRVEGIRTLVSAKVISTDRKGPRPVVIQSEDGQIYFTDAYGVGNSSFRVVLEASTPGFVIPVPERITEYRVASIYRVWPQVCLSPPFTHPAEALWWVHENLTDSEPYNIIRFSSKEDGTDPMFGVVKSFP